MSDELGKEEHDAKLNSLRDACASGDIDRISELALCTGGLISDEIRKTAWPLLLGCPPDHRIQKVAPWTSLPSHGEEAQVRLDVDRSFVYYPKGEDEAQLHRRKEDLYAIIVEILRRYPFLCYFQGYHDIAQVFLLVLGPIEAAAAVARLSLLRIRDFMLPTLAGAVAHLEMLPHILRAADPVLEKHVSATQPFFALASTLTLYAHDIEDYADIARLFDFLLATEASMSLYLFASIIISRREELLEVDREEADMLHFVVSKLPKPLQLESLIQNAVALFKQYPPSQLPGKPWRRLDNSSVLMTTRSLHAVTHQSDRDGELAFKKQAARIRRKQTLQYARKQIWKHRRPAGLGVAIAVAVLSIYMRRTLVIPDLWRVFKSASFRGI